MEIYLKYFFFIFKVKEFYKKKNQIKLFIRSNIFISIAVANSCLRISAKNIRNSTKYLFIIPLYFFFFFEKELQELFASIFMANFPDVSEIYNRSRFSSEIHPAVSLETLLVFILSFKNLLRY